MSTSYWLIDADLEEADGPSSSMGTFNTNGVAGSNGQYLRT